MISIKNLKLVAFDWEQVSAFINNWFGEDNKQAQNLINQLQTEPILRSQARIPLLLSFICLIAMKNMDIPKRRNDLYDTVIRLLLEGPWREPNLREHDEGRLEEKFHLLRYIAWYFATFKGSWHDLFTSHDLNTAIQASSSEKYLIRTAPHKKSILWEISEQDGILVKAGEPGFGMAKSQIPYLFLHRTFHEFLVASYLSNLETEQWLPFIKSHLWFDPDWEIVITLLAGCLGNPQLLLEEMINEKDDVFHTQLLLAGRCLAEIEKNLITNQLRKKIISQLLELLYSTSERNRNQAALVLGLVDNSVTPKLLELTKGNKWYTRCAAIKALGLLGDPQSGNHLISILSNKDENAKVRAEAAKSLGEINYVSSTKELIEAMDDRYINIRIAAIESLGKIKCKNNIENIISRILDDKEDTSVIDASYRSIKNFGKEAENALLVYLQENELNSKIKYLKALSFFNNSHVFEFLLQMVKNKYEKQETRYFIIFHLGENYGRKCIDLFLSIIEDDDESYYIKSSAIRALGIAGGAKAARILTSLLTINKSLEVRKDLASALCNIDDYYSAEGIIQSLNDKNYLVRNAAVNALKMVKDKGIIDLLIKISFHDKYERVRSIASGILAHQGCPQMVDYWLDALSKESSSISKWHASIGLGRVSTNKIRIASELIDALNKKNGQYIRKNLIDALINIGDPIAIESILIILTNKDEDLQLRMKAAEALEELIHNCNPIDFCNMIFKYWTSSTHVRGSKSCLYFLLVCIGPRLRVEVGEDWPKWRSRLISFHE